MAKNAKATDSVDSNGVITITYTSPDVSLVFGDLPHASQVYLAQYGLNKALQDAASGTLKAATDAYNGTDEAAAKARKKYYDATNVDSNDYDNGASYAEAVALAQKNSRLADIMSGDVSVGTTGPRLRGIDAVMFDVAIERLKVAFGNAGKKFPETAAEVRRIAGLYIAKYDGDVRAEAQRRMDAENLPAIDLDDLMTETE